MTFNGTPITGTNIGTASDNNWGFQNSQSYRADVTSLVTGNGSYSLSNFRKTGRRRRHQRRLADRVLQRRDPSNDRNVVLWNGNDSNIAFGSDPADWDETISGVPYPGSGTASLDLVVSDGQSFNDAAVVLNGNTDDSVGRPRIFQGDSGPITPEIRTVSPARSGTSSRSTSRRSSTPGSNDLHLTSGTDGDALSLVVAIANVPASAPIP